MVRICQPKKRCERSRAKQKRSFVHHPRALNGNKGLLVAKTCCQTRGKRNREKQHCPCLSVMLGSPRQTTRTPALRSRFSRPQASLRAGNPKPIGPVTISRVPARQNRLTPPARPRPNPARVPGAGARSVGGSCCADPEATREERRGRLL